MITIWGKDRIIHIKPTPQWKINKALDIIKSTIDGKIGFCYDSVLHIPRYEGMDLNNKIRSYREKLYNELNDHRAMELRSDLKDLKNKLKDHILYDLPSYKKLLSNYKKIKRSLQLIQNEGLIDSFTLTSSGRLKVNWFDPESSRFEYSEIKQGVTYTLEQVPVIKTSAQIEREFQNDSIFSTQYPKGIKQGKMYKEYEGNQSIGPVGIDPIVMRYKKGQTTQIPKLKEMDDLFKDLTEEKAIIIIANLLYLRRKYHGKCNKR